MFAAENFVFGSERVKDSRGALPRLRSNFVCPSLIFPFHSTNWQWSNIVFNITIKCLDINEQSVKNKAQTLRKCELNFTSKSGTHLL